MITRKKRKAIMAAIAGIIVIIAVGIAVYTSTTKEEPPSMTYEITEADIFALDSFKAQDITVKGIKLGDSFETAIEKLGTPDNQFVVDERTLNLEYGKSMKLVDTGLIVQIQDNKINSFTFKQPFNPLLVGKTKIIHTKDEIYLNVLGKPDNIYFIPMAPGSALAYKVLEYQDRGLYILLRKEEENGFSLRAKPLEVRN